MSSPSKKRTGFNVSRWSMRKVLGSFRARTMHLNRKRMFEQVQCRYICCCSSKCNGSQTSSLCLPVSINPSLWSIVLCVTSQQLNHHFCRRLTVKSENTIKKNCSVVPKEGERVKVGPPNRFRESQTFSHMSFAVLASSLIINTFCWKKKKKKKQQLAIGMHHQSYPHIQLLVLVYLGIPEHVCYKNKYSCPH